MGKVPKRNVFLCLGPLHAKVEFTEAAKMLVDMGLILYCSRGTYDFYSSRGLPVHLLHKPLSKTKPNVDEYLADGKIDLVINVRDWQAVDFSVCLLTDIKLAALVITALHRGKATTIK